MKMVYKSCSGEAVSFDFICEILFELEVSCVL